MDSDPRQEPYCRAPYNVSPSKIKEDPSFKDALIFWNGNVETSGNPLAAFTFPSGKVRKISAEICF